MKPWKISFLTALSFLGFIGVFLFAACERDACTNVTCFNGGSCSVGSCHCPTGWEGTQCGYKSVDRFIGGYAGFTTCNGLAQTIDTVWIVGDINHINFVYITQKSQPDVTLHGYVDASSATYSIIVPSDSATNHLLIHTITIQSNKTLSVHTFLNDKTNPANPVVSECSFLSDKRF